MKDERRQEFKAIVRSVEATIGRRLSTDDFFLVEDIISIYDKRVRDKESIIIHGWIILGTSRRCQDCGTVQYWNKSTETWEADRIAEE